MTTKTVPATVSETVTGGKGRAAINRDGQTHHTTAQPRTQAANYNLAHALRYALAGWRVLPLQPNGKAPLTAHGVKDASADPEQIGAWWRRWPAANIGLALDNAHVVLDVDPRHGGNLEDVHKLGVDVDATPTQRTWSGGWHVLLEKPVSMAFGGKVPGVPGIDIKTDGGYIVAAPSVIDGKPYVWERDPLDVDPARIPLELAERLAKRTTAAPTDAQRRTAAQPAQPGQYDAATVKSMLDVLNPWQDGYTWWLSILMAVHSALGDDGLDLAEAWGEGKPGEIAGKFATFDAAGGVSIATLLYHAKQAGWQPAAAADETDLPAAWRITAEDWKTCPTCAALHTDRYSDNSLVHHHNWCRRKTCPVYRKVRARDALRPVFGWPGVQLETVPAAAWRKWRKNADRLHGDRWRATPPLANGDRLALYSVDSDGLNLDDVLNVAVTAILENEAARRARRQALAFLNTLPENEALDPVTLARMKEALDLLASTPKGGNVSTPRRKRTAGAELEATPKPPRPHKVETLLVSKPWHRPAMLAVLNRLQIPWERRSYGGWRTEPLTDVQMLQVTTALAFAVPGARVLSAALEAGSYAELSTAPAPSVFLNAPQAAEWYHRRGRKVPELERKALE